MPSCRIYYWDNGVGVKTDASLISECLGEEFKCEVFDFSSSESNEDFFNYTVERENVDIGIFIQNYHPNLLADNKINILIINEEWISFEDLLHLNDFDHIIVKSEYAKKLLYGMHPSIHVLHFWSRDLHSEYYSKFKSNNILHFAGKSIQKNTESVINNTDIHIFDSNGRFKDVRKEKYYCNFISDNKLQRVFNTCDTHVCPSLYEAHGHYFFEALLCNKKVIASKCPVWEELVDPEYVVYIETQNCVFNHPDHDWLSGELPEKTFTKYPFRRGFVVEPDSINEAIENSKDKKPRKYILDLFSKNQQKFLDFFKALL